MGGFDPKFFVPTSFHHFLVRGRKWLYSQEFVYASCACAVGE
jgi:hypothetical protein